MFFPVVELCACLFLTHQTCSQHTGGFFFFFPLLPLVPVSSLIVLSDVCLEERGDP